MTSTSTCNITWLRHGCELRKKTLQGCDTPSGSDCVGRLETGALCEIAKGCWYRNVYLGLCPFNAGGDCQLRNERAAFCSTKDLPAGCELRDFSLISCSAITSDCVPRLNTGAECALDKGCWYRNAALNDCAYNAGKECKLRRETTAMCGLADLYAGCQLREKSLKDCIRRGSNCEARLNTGVSCTVDAGCWYRMDTLADCKKGSDAKCQLRTEDGAVCDLGDPTYIAFQVCMLRTDSLRSCTTPSAKCQPMDHTGTACMLEPGCWYRTPLLVNCPYDSGGECKLRKEDSVACLQKDITVGCQLRETSMKGCTMLSDQCKGRDENGVDCKLGAGCWYRTPQLAKCAFDAGGECKPRKEDSSLCTVADFPKGCQLREVSLKDCTAQSAECESRDENGVKCMIQPGCWYRTLTLQDCPADAGSECTLRKEDGRACLESDLVKGCQLRESSVKNCVTLSTTCEGRDEKGAKCTIPVGCWYRTVMLTDCKFDAGGDCQLRHETAKTCAIADLTAGCQLREESLKDCSTPGAKCQARTEDGATCTLDPGCWFRSPQLADCAYDSGGECKLRDEDAKVCTEADLVAWCQLRQPSLKDCTTPGATCEGRDERGAECTIAPGCWYRTPVLFDCSFANGGDCKLRKEDATTCSVVDQVAGCQLREESLKDCSTPGPTCKSRTETGTTCTIAAGCWFRNLQLADCSYNSGTAECQLRKEDATTCTVADLAAVCQLRELSLKGCTVPSKDCVPRDQTGTTCTIEPGCWFRTPVLVDCAFNTGGECSLRKEDGSDCAESDLTAGCQLREDNLKDCETPAANCKGHDSKGADCTIEPGCWYRTPQLAKCAFDAGGDCKLRKEDASTCTVGDLLVGCQLREVSLKQCIKSTAECEGRKEDGAKCTIQPGCWYRTPTLGDCAASTGGECKLRRETALECTVADLAAGCQLRESSVKDCTTPSAECESRDEKGEKCTLAVGCWYRTPVLADCKFDTGGECKLRRENAKLCTVLDLIAGCQLREDSIKDCSTPGAKCLPRTEAGVSCTPEQGCWFRNAQLADCKYDTGNECKLRKEDATDCTVTDLLAGCQLRDASLKDCTAPGANCERRDETGAKCKLDAGCWFRNPVLADCQLASGGECKLRREDASTCTVADLIAGCQLRELSLKDCTTPGPSCEGRTEMGTICKIPAGCWFRNLQLADCAYNLGTAECQLRKEDATTCAVGDLAAVCQLREISLKDCTTPSADCVSRDQTGATCTLETGCWFRTPVLVDCAHNAGADCSLRKEDASTCTEGDLTGGCQLREESLKDCDTPSDKCKGRDTKGVDCTIAPGCWYRTPQLAKCPFDAGGDCKLKKENAANCAVADLSEGCHLREVSLKECVKPTADCEGRDVNGGKCTIEPGCWYRTPTLHDCPSDAGGDCKLRRETAIECTAALLTVGCQLRENSVKDCTTPSSVCESRDEKGATCTLATGCWYRTPVLADCKYDTGNECKLRKEDATDCTVADLVAGCQLRDASLKDCTAPGANCESRDETGAKCKLDAGCWFRNPVLADCQFASGEECRLRREDASTCTVEDLAAVCQLREISMKDCTTPSADCVSRDQTGATCALETGCWFRTPVLVDCAHNAGADCSLRKEDAATCTEGDLTGGCQLREESLKDCDTPSDKCKGRDTKSVDCTIAPGCWYRTPQLAKCPFDAGGDCKLKKENAANCAVADLSEGCHLREVSLKECVKPTADCEGRDVNGGKCTIEPGCWYRTPTLHDCPSDASGDCKLRRETAIECTAAVLTVGCQLRENSVKDCTTPSSVCESRDEKGATCTLATGCWYRTPVLADCKYDTGNECKLRKEDATDCTVADLVAGCQLRDASLKDCTAPGANCESRDETGAKCKLDAGCWFRNPVLADCQFASGEECRLRREDASTCTVMDLAAVCQLREISMKDCTTPSADCVSRDQTGATCTLETGCWFRTPVLVNCAHNARADCSLRKEDAATCTEGDLTGGCQLREESLKDCDTPSDKCKGRDTKGVDCTIAPGCWYRTPQLAKCPFDAGGDCKLKKENAANCAVADLSEGCHLREVSLKECVKPTADCEGRDVNGGKCTIEPGCWYRTPTLHNCPSDAGGDCKLRRETAIECTAAVLTVGCQLRENSVKDCTTPSSVCESRDEKGATCTLATGCWYRNPVLADCKYDMGNECKLRKEDATDCTVADLVAGCQLRDPSLKDCTAPGAKCESRDEKGAKCKLDAGCWFRNLVLTDCQFASGEECRLRREDASTCTVMDLAAVCQLREISMKDCTTPSADCVSRDQTGATCTLEKGCWFRTPVLVDCAHNAGADCNLRKEDAATCTEGDLTGGCQLREESLKDCDTPSDKCKGRDTKGVDCTIAPGCWYRTPQLAKCPFNASGDCKLKKEDAANCAVADLSEGCHLREVSLKECVKPTADCEGRDDNGGKCTIEPGCWYRTPTLHDCPSDAGGDCKLRRETAIECTAADLTVGCQLRENSVKDCTTPSSVCESRDENGAKCTLVTGCWYRTPVLSDCKFDAGDECKLRRENAKTCSVSDLIPGCQLREDSIKDCAKPGTKCQPRTEAGVTCKPDPGCWFRNPQLADCKYDMGGECKLRKEDATDCTVADLVAGCQLRQSSLKDCYTPGAKCEGRDEKGAKCKFDTGCWYRNPVLADCSFADGGDCKLRRQDATFCAVGDMVAGCHLREESLKECSTPGPSCKPRTEAGITWRFCRLRRGFPFRLVYLEVTGKQLSSTAQLSFSSLFNVSAH